MLEASIGLTAYTPPGVPAECVNMDPQFIFSAPASLDAQGQPVSESVTFTYTTSVTTQTGTQFYTCTATIYPTGSGVTPPPDSSPFWTFHHRFLNATPQNGAPAARVSGVYQLSVTWNGVNAASLTFTFTASTAPAPVALAGLAVTGDQILIPETGFDAVALLENEGDLTEITISWNSDSNAAYYQYELSWLPVDPGTGAFPDEYTSITGLVGVSASTISVSSRNVASQS